MNTKLVSVSFLLLSIFVLFIYDARFDPIEHAHRLMSVQDASYNKSLPTASILDDEVAANDAAEHTGEDLEEKSNTRVDVPSEEDTARVGALVDETNLFDMAKFSSPTTGKPTTSCGRQDGSGGKAGTQKHCTLGSWIQSDLEPWSSTGITAKSVTRALSLGTEINRYVIKDGKLYMSEFKSKSKWGDSKRWYNAWGLLELLELYPEEVPDVDIAINGADNPLVGAQEMYAVGKKPNGKVINSLRPWNTSKEKSPPAMFSVCRDDNNVDLLWPQYNIWGMDWAGMGMREAPWCAQFPILRETWLRRGIRDRPGKLFWRGQLKSNSHTRGAMVRCRTTLLPRNDRAIFDVMTNGVVVQKGGKYMPGVPTKSGKQVLASERCNAKYLLHLEGRTFSLAQLPQAGCGSLMVMGPHQFYTPIERAYRSNGFYLPVQLPVYKPMEDKGFTMERASCENVSAAIKWAESHKGAVEAEAVAAEAAKWTERELSMQGIHRYMLEMLKGYAKMMKHEPSVKGLKLVTRSLIDRNTKRKQRCEVNELAPANVL